MRKRKTFFTQHLQNRFLVLESPVVFLLAEAEDDVVGPPDLDAHADVQVDHEDEGQHEEAERRQFEQRRIILEHGTKC